MILAQSTHWRAEVPKGNDAVCLTLLRDALRSEHEELGELRIDVPLEDWQRLVRVVRADRKLLGGILLDLARNKDQVSAAIASDRLFLSLSELIGRATLALLEADLLQAVVPAASEDE